MSAHDFLSLGFFTWLNENPIHFVKSHSISLSRPKCNTMKTRQITKEQFFLTGKYTMRSIHFILPLK